MKKKVLVADDNASIIEVVKIVLKDKNYDIVAVQDGAAVVATVKKTQPDIILLDIWIVNENGKAIAKKIKENDTMKHIPIIMMSASNETETIAKESAVDDFITKPFDINDLVHIVQKYT